MNVTPADPTGGLNDVRESLYRTTVATFVVKNERMVSAIVAGAVTGAALSYYLDTTHTDADYVVQHYDYETKAHLQVSSWQAMQYGILGSIIGGVIVFLLGKGVQMAAANKDSSREEKLIGPAAWVEVVQGTAPAAACRQFNGRLCSTLDVELKRIDPLDFTRIAKRAKLMTQGGTDVPAKGALELITSDDSVGGGVVRTGYETFASARNGSNVETGFLYYCLCTYTQGIRWGTADAHAYCFGPRSPLSLTQQGVIASVIGSANMQQPQDWWTLSRAAQYMLVTTSLLWAPRQSDMAVGFTIGTQEATRVEDELRDHSPTRWMQADDLQEADVTRKALHVRALSQLGGWYSMTRNEQEFIQRAWGARPPKSDYPLDLSNVHTVSADSIRRLSDVLQNISFEYRDSEVFQVAVRYATTPAEVALQLRHDGTSSRVDYMTNNREMLEALAELVGFQVMRRIQDSPSPGDTIQEFLNSTAEVHGHVISRGWLWSWRDEIREAGNLRHLEQAMQPTDGKFTDAYTAIIRGGDDVADMERSSDWTWKIPDKAELVIMSGSPHLKSLIAIHDHATQYRYTNTDAPVKIVMGLHVNGSMSLAEKYRQFELRVPLETLYIKELLDGSGANTETVTTDQGQTYTLTGFAAGTVSFVTITDPGSERITRWMLSLLQGNDDIGLEQVVLETFRTTMEHAMNTRMEMTGEEDTTLLKKTLEKCCGTYSQRGFGTNLSSKFMTLLNFPIGYMDEFMAEIDQNYQSRVSSGPENYQSRVSSRPKKSNLWPHTP